MVQPLADVPDPPSVEHPDHPATNSPTEQEQDSEHPSILILGGGFFGLSTAWHLARAGYTRVTVLDRYPVPSPFADGHDTAKIVRAQSINLTYSNLGNQSIDAWEQLPPFSTNGLFHRTGWLLSVRENTPHVQNVISTAIANNDQYTSRAGAAVRINGPEDLQRCLPHFVTLNKPGATAAGIYNPDGGWVEAKHAMEVLAKEAEAMGVKFIFGDQGTVRALVRAHELPPTQFNDGANHVNGVNSTLSNDAVSTDRQRVVGVETEDGSRHTADKIIMALGDFAENLIDFGGQLVQIMYVRAFLQLNAEQIKLYHSLPVIETTEHGHLFPPDEHGRLKVCSDNFDIQVIPAKDGGGTNDSHSNASSAISGTSFRRHGRWRAGASSVASSADAAESDWSSSRLGPDFRQEDLRHALDVVRKFLPGLVDCEVASCEVVYENECFDHDLIISPDPSSPSTLLVVSAGSGHAFKFFPIIGGYVRQALEGTLSDELRHRWRWRPDAVPPEDELADLREAPPETPS